MSLRNSIQRKWLDLYKIALKKILIELGATKQISLYYFLDNGTHLVISLCPWIVWIFFGFLYSLKKIM